MEKGVWDMKRSEEDLGGHREVYIARLIFTMVVFTLEDTFTGRSYGACFRVLGRGYMVLYMEKLTEE